MLDDNNLAYLERVINNNELVLFLGAGFSSQAINKLNTQIPTSYGLKKLLLQYLGYDYNDENEINNSDLQQLFDLALKSPKGFDSLSSLLDHNFTIDSFPDWYKILTQIYWYRIYTTNIDNLVESVFRKSLTEIRKIDTIVGTTQDFQERDQFINSIQLIKLHGSLPSSPSEITFSTSQYATRSAKINDVWYDHFIRDYSTKTVLFIGTSLSEPLFYKYIEIREGKSSETGKILNFPERRMKSFLVSPDLNKVREDFFKQMNIISVKANAEEFFEYLSNKIKLIPSRLEILKLKVPSFVEDLIKFNDTSHKGKTKFIESFYKGFERIPEINFRSDYRPDYLLGYSPNWQDLANNFDAPRQINTEVKELIKSAFLEDRLRLFTLIGSAGSGKSTIIMRAAIELKKEGYTIFFCSGKFLPSKYELEEFLSLVDKKVILIIDNGEIVAPVLPELLERIQLVKYPPTVLIASQANLYDRLENKLIGRISPELIKVPNLSSHDIENILKVLTHNGLLGKLQGKSDIEQKNEFEIRAKSQILVAMREATKGKGFDEIIEEEYKLIEPVNARYLLLCVSIATAVNFSLTKGQFVSCSDSSAFETLGYLEKNLRDVVIEDRFNKELLSARHSLIAKHILEKAASKQELKNSYIRLLQTLSHDFQVGNSKRSPTFRLYQLIINHRRIYERFDENIAYAREIYDTIKPQFQFDWHFWLQYGSLELEYGELNYAENYLSQANGLNDNADFIIHANAHLLLKKAIFASNLTTSIKLKDEAEEMLKKQFEKHSMNDPYPYHILCSQLLKWINNWVTKKDAKKIEFEKLRGFILEATQRFPDSEKLKDLFEEINKNYLSLGLLSS